MKSFRLAYLALSLAIFFVLGCAGSGSEGSFLVIPKYGPADALQIDQLTTLEGQAIGQLVCNTDDDPQCVISFGPVAAGPGGVLVTTDAVGGGQEWQILGSASANCEDGYSSGTVVPPPGGNVPLICEDPTTYFQATPGEWIANQMPTTITFKAVSNTFPTAQYKTATTSYNTSGDVQWQGSPVSSTQTVIKMAVPSDLVGTHVIVFRNPSTNAVLGAAAYVVEPIPPNCGNAEQGATPNGKCPPQ